MERDPLALVRGHISRRIEEIHARSDRLSPLDLHTRMDAIREIAAQHGMEALEGLAPAARRSWRFSLGTG